MPTYWHVATSGYCTYLDTQGLLLRALFSPTYVVKTEYLRECSASLVWPYMHQLESCLWSNIWFARLPRLLPYVPLYRLRRHWENYCNCALVHLDEHLSRESRQLTVMIQRETGQPLDDSAESSRFLHINEGPVSRSCTYVHHLRMNAEVLGAI